MHPFGSGGGGQDAAEPLMTLSDRKNTVELWPTKVTIRRHGMLNRINVGSMGEKDIYLSSLTGIQIKKPGITTGYIQFQTSGSRDDKGGVTGAVKDENSVLFTGKENYEIAQEMKLWIEDLIRDLGSAAEAPQSTSLADELAKLAALRDQGILTNTEFEDQKARLLGAR